MTAEAAPAALFPVPDNCFALTVTAIQHYTDRLFRFETDRPGSFRFRSGEFVMIGLPGTKPVWRAYSVASPAWDERLEFFSIKVPDGPLTSELQKIQPGDTVWMRRKPTGTLVLDALLPGRRLYMISTGTGIAPFASLMRDPETYEKFDQVILTHTCRLKAELVYGFELTEQVLGHEFLGELAQGKLTHYATTTREPSDRMGRVTDLIENGRLFSDLGVPPLDPAVDRIMVCGSMAMNKDVKALAEARGFHEGSNADPGQFVIERAFVG